VGSHRLDKLQKKCTRLVAASNKVYQLLDRGWWFSAGTPASSTNTTGRHDIAEILMKVALNTINQKQIQEEHRNTLPSWNSIHDIKIRLT
jgi:hypothetical protein